MPRTVIIGEKADYVSEQGACTLEMGDDWSGHFDRPAPLRGVVSLRRTRSISTTGIFEKIRG